MVLLQQELMWEALATGVGRWPRKMGEGSRAIACWSYVQMESLLEKAQVGISIYDATRELWVWETTDFWGESLSSI